MWGDPDVADRILALLRRYGWEIGPRELHEEAESAREPRAREAIEFFVGWMAAERGAEDAAEAFLAASEDAPELAAWATFGRAFLALRRKDNRRAGALLDAAEAKLGPDDPTLRAAIAHLRGVVAFHHGDSDRAMGFLRAALEGFGAGHFGTGRVLDTFGMAYAGRDNFHAAEEFYRKAIEVKTRKDDQAGLALSWGNLGRLYLDWGELDRAEACFQADLDLAQRTRDDRGEAQMHGHLGRVALERGLRDQVAGRAGEAERHWEAAAAYLDAAIRGAESGRWTALEGYARKDRARLDLATDRLEEAGAQAGRAEELFRAVGFAEGLAHVDRVRGTLHRRRGDLDRSRRSLLAALHHFEAAGERAEVARTKWELARTARAGGEPGPQVGRRYLDALAAAEACRRADLVRGIGAELRHEDPRAHAEHVFGRVRGRDVPEDTDSLMDGAPEPISALFLDLKGSTPLARDLAPVDLMATLNQMMADMVAVLRRHRALMVSFRGDGFLALFRAADHARRAVEAGLDLHAQMAEFNGPRAVLGLAPLEIRVGISTGAAVLGNLGTYDLMDFTAIGLAVNRGARLEGAGRPGRPCLDRETQTAVGDRYTYSPDSPRTVDLKGLGLQPVWDVVGRAISGPTPPPV